MSPWRAARADDMCFRHSMEGPSFLSVCLVSFPAPFLMSILTSSMVMIGWTSPVRGVCLNGRAAMGLRALIVSLLRQKLLARLLFDSSTVLHGRTGRSRVLGRCHVGGRGGAQPFFPSLLFFFLSFLTFSPAVMHVFFEGGRFFLWE